MSTYYYPLNDNFSRINIEDDGKHTMIMFFDRLGANIGKWTILSEFKLDILYLLREEGKIYYHSLCVDDGKVLYMKYVYDEKCKAKQFISDCGKVFSREYLEEKVNGC